MDIEVRSVVPATEGRPVGALGRPRRRVVASNRPTGSGSIDGTGTVHWTVVIPGTSATRRSKRPCRYPLVSTRSAVVTTSGRSDIGDVVQYSRCTLFRSARYVTHDQRSPPPSTNASLRSRTSNGSWAFSSASTPAPRREIETAWPSLSAARPSRMAVPAVWDRRSRARRRCNRSKRIVAHYYCEI